MPSSSARKLPRLPRPPIPGLPAPPDPEEGPAGPLRVIKEGIRKGKKALEEARREVRELGDELKH